MNKLIPITWLLLFVVQLQISTAQNAKTNIVIILADDLGFSDLGCYGGEIRTPNLDMLAENGLRFTQFYNTGRCWPTRGALLTGYYPHQIRRDKIEGVNPSGAGGIRPAWARLLPEMLQQSNYRSYHSGKWHIDGQPLDNGFDRSYYLRDQGRFFNPQVHYEDGRKLPAVEPGTDYYATRAIADHAIKCLQEHQKQYADQPFFHFIPFTAPHFPLHALPEDIARYNKTYQKDWEKVRRKRYRRQKRMDIIEADLSQVESEVGPPYHFPEALEILGPEEVNRPIPWKELTKEQRQFQADKMSIHAAMIDRMDQDIGRIIAQIKAMNVFENTLILFFSDNGASAEIMVRSDGHDHHAPRGSAASYLCLGPSCSTTANTPFRKHKTWVHEGGISTPFIAHWPKGIHESGVLRHNQGHVVDLVPTILDITDTKALVEWNGQDIPPAPGVSLLPTFNKDNSVQHDYLWWYHEGNRAIRVDNWKLVAAGEEAPWELYDLATDRTEMKNLAQKLPEKVLALEKLWQTRLLSFKALALKDLTK